MALELDLTPEEIEEMSMSEEEMAEILIEMDLIDEKSYREYKESENG